MDLYEHMGKDLFRAHGMQTPRGIVAFSSADAAVGDRRAGRPVGGEDPGAGRRPRQGRRCRALRHAGGRRRGRRPDARHRLQGLPRDARPRRGAAADRARVLHVAPAGPLTRRLPGDDDGRGRRGHRGARADAAGGAPARAHRPDARAPRVSRPRADRDAPGRGAGRERRDAFGRCTSSSSSATRRSSRSTRSSCWRTTASSRSTPRSRSTTTRCGAIRTSRSWREQFPIDEVEARAKEKGLQYVKLDGEVGIIGNGAGLVMSTLDVVAQAGASAANFLDVGGGARAEQMATSLEVVLSDPAVKVVLVNIFGGITRCDLVAQGILEALERDRGARPHRGSPRRDERGGRPSDPGGRGASADRPAANMLEAAEEAADLAGAEPREHPRRRTTTLRGPGHHGERGDVPHAPQPRLRHERRRRRDPGEGGAGRGGDPGLRHGRGAVAGDGRQHVDDLRPAAVRRGGDPGGGRRRRRAGRLHHRGHPRPRHGERPQLPRGVEDEARRARTAPASSRPGSRTSASSRARSARRARRTRVERAARSSIRSCTSSRSGASASRRASGMGGDPVHGIGFVEALELFQADAGDRA